MGHLSAVKWIAARSRKVIVAIGSAQYANQPQNPFSAKERARMIEGQLEAAGLGEKSAVVPVSDVNSDAIWAGHVDRHVPRYDVVYSNNALVKRLMKKAGKAVKAVPFFKKEKYNATKIRARMRKGMRWQDRVPKKILSELEKINAEERIRKLQS